MQAVIINLSMGVFWLFLGGTILIYEWANGPLAYRPLDISLGWWCLGLSAFNWFRVSYNWAAVQRRRRELAASSTLARSTVRRASRSPDEPPDPNFRFDNPPPSNPEDKSS